MGTCPIALMMTELEKMTTDLVPVPAIPCYAKKPYEGYYRMKSIIEGMLNDWVDSLSLHGPWYRDSEELCEIAPSGRVYYYM